MSEKIFSTGLLRSGGAVGTWRLNPDYVVKYSLMSGINPMPTTVWDGSHYVEWNDNALAYVRENPATIRVQSNGDAGKVINSVQEDLIDYFLGHNSSYTSISDDYRVSFSDVSNITFSKQTTKGPGEIFIGNADWINPIHEGGTIARVDPTTRGLVNADVLLDTTNISSENHSYVFQSAGLQIGHQGAHVVLHELAHSIGLIHANVYLGPYANQKYTIMTEHSDGSETHPTMPGVWATGLQLFDIAAVQAVYGYNWSVRAESNTYSSSTAFQSTNASGAFIYTIWDGGGDDTIDASGYSNRAIIDLRQGQFSSIGLNASGGDALNNVAIAYHALIENATGTDAGDTLIGNNWNNILLGGDGNDSLYGDGRVFDGKDGFIEVGSDPLYDPNARMPLTLLDDDTLDGGTGTDVVYGGMGNDYFFARGNENILNPLLEGDIYNGGGTGLSSENDGYDFITYGSVNFGIKLDATANTITVQKWDSTSGTSGEVDELISIESIWGTLEDDLFILPPSVNYNFAIDGLSGADTYDLSNWIKAGMGGIKPKISADGDDTIIAPNWSPKDVDVKFTRDGALLFADPEVNSPLHGSIFIYGATASTVIDSKKYGSHALSEFNEEDDDDSNGADDTDTNGLYPFAPIDPALVPQPPSPLVLDLDNSGDVELTALGDVPAYFDLTGDGNAELTGWVSATDGLLARDINENGTIDNLGELFGTQDTDGFTVLRELDSNSDGKITAADAEWDSLRVWVDADQDGFTDAGELKMLASVGITGISLNAALQSEVEIAGNKITHVGTFTTSDNVEHKIVDAWFNYNPALTVNREEYDLDPRAMLMPDLRGFGQLKDLRIAVSLDNEGPNSLMTKLLAIQSTIADGVAGVFENWQSLQDDVEEMMLQWAGVDGVDPASRGQWVNAQHAAFYEKITGVPLLQHGVPELRPQKGHLVDDMFDYIKVFFTAQIVAQVLGGDLFQGGAAYDLATGKITGDFGLQQYAIDSVLAVAAASGEPADIFAGFAQFLGYTVGPGNLSSEDISALDAAVGAALMPLVPDWAGVEGVMTAKFGQIIQSAADWDVLETMDAMQVKIYGELIYATEEDDISVGSSNAPNHYHGLEGNDTVQGGDVQDRLMGDAGDDTLDGGGGDDFLIGGDGDDTYIYSGGNDVIKEGDASTDGSGTDTIQVAASTGFSVSDITGFYLQSDDVFGIKQNLVIQFSNGETLLIDGQFERGELVAGSVEEIVFLHDSSSISLTALTTIAISGTNGDDEVYGAFDNNGTADTIYGLNGNDRLAGLDGDDTLFGGEGADVVSGGDGHDVLDGGDGDDLLIGDSLSAPTIAGDDSYYLSAGHDLIRDWGGADKAIFREGVTAEDVSIFVRNDDLVISWDGNETVIEDHFGGDPDVDFTVEELHFSDTTVIDLTTAAMNGTEGDDNFAGRRSTNHNQNDIMNGLGGNDVLRGWVGDDTMDGGEGNDTLNGEAGNDTLNGGAGDDVYIVALDGESDTISDVGGGEDTLAMGGLRFDFDLLEFVHDYDAHQISVTIAGDDVTLEVGGADNEILLLGQADIPTIEWLSVAQFGVRLDLTSVGDWLLGTDSAITPDYLVDSSGTADDTIFAYAGDDTVDADGGDDVVFAGNGDDLVDGGDGNDNLFGGIGEDDIQGGDGDDLVYGEEGDDVIAGGDGEDTLYGGFGADTLEGGDGNDILDAFDPHLRGSFTNPSSDPDSHEIVPINLDESINTLSGGAGEDTLLGAYGDDVLQGGADSDLYSLDGDGSGNDVIADVSGDNDTIDLSFINLAGIAFIQDGNDLLLDFGSTIRIVDHFDAGTTNQIEHLLTADGVFNLTSLLPQVGGNHVPVALNDYFVIDEDTPLTANVLTDRPDGQDYDSDSDTLSVQAATVTTAEGVSVIINAAGDFTYTPNENFIGTDSFQYTVDDGNGGTANATVYIEVSNPVNDVPVAQDDAFSFAFGDVVTGSVFDDNGAGADSDADGESLGVVESTVMTAGGYEVTFGLGGNFTVALPVDFFGADSFTYTVTDYKGGFSTDTATVTFEVVAPSGATGGTAGADSTDGTSGTDEIYGFAGDDTIDGGDGADTLWGGDGEDTLSGGLGDDVLDGGADADLLYGGDGDDDMTGSTGEDSLVGGDGNDTLSGGADDDTIEGGDGNDTLRGDGGTDTLYGGDGDDIYIVSDSNDILSEASAEGNDTVSASVNYTLGGNIENLALSGSHALTGTGNSLNNVLTGNAGSNILQGEDGDDTILGAGGSDTLYGGDGGDTLDGGAGADIARGGGGNDTYFVDATGDIVSEEASEGTDTVYSGSTYTLGDNVENLVLTGIGAVNGTGNALDNTLTGNGNDNTLDGGVGADLLTGGTGDDSYVVDDAGDVVDEDEDEGNDTVLVDFGYTLGDHLENLVLTGSANISGTGNDADNRIDGNGGDNTLDGAVGADIMSGGDGNDVYIVDDSDDVVLEDLDEGIDSVWSEASFALGDNIEELALQGSSAIDGEGNDLDNLITGNVAANTLNGGLGADTLVGGDGNDTYIVDDEGDVVSEDSAYGTDDVVSFIDYTLGANVENLTLAGTAVNGTGNALDNTLAGGEADNTLDGGAGADTMAGAAGHDVYIVDDAGDVVIEESDEGTDAVYADVDFTLSDNVENLFLTGGSAIDGAGNALDNTISGNSGVNSLSGGAGNDTLDGGAGADVMIGNDGNDVYVVDNAGDVVSEDASEGVDIVQSSVTYALASNIDNLTLTGSADINGTGNALANTLSGNSGANTLDGGAGADTMIGGAGDDFYTVDDAGDIVVEGSGAGTDHVNASVSYTLTSNVETLTSLGSSGIHATGNALANILTGNSGNNTLDGGVGADTMAGGTGNDTYVIDNASDVVSEASGAGTDSVLSGISHTMGSDVENLTLTGTSGINATGNALDNTVAGNSGANTLAGAGGSDTYLLGEGAGVDLITESAGTLDSIVFDSSVTTGSVTYTHSGNDLVIGYGSMGDSVTVSNFFSGSSNQIEQVVFHDTTVHDLAYIIAAANVISGTSGADTLVGTSGDDTLNGLDGNDTLSGLGGIDVIYGGNGHDTLDGGSGNDTMIGGAGNDVYIADSTSDLLSELSGEGTDTVQTALTYTLATYFENLVLTGSSTVNGTGNSSDNVITGNSGVNILTGNAGADTLDGGAGADTMVGGNDNDVYYVDNVGDVVTETASIGAGGGEDTVVSSITFTLASLANVENLTLTGSGDLTATGNSGVNILIGNTGNNTLIGNAGADTMIGGTGNDNYYVDSSSDVVLENSGEGVDKVTLTSGSYTMAANVENLFMNAGATDATGNGLDNSMDGNSATNTIYGSDGNDTIDGGGGTDWLEGGDGHDYLLGGTDRDTLYGGLGNDTLDGGASNNFMYGGDGNDVYYLGTGADLVVENSGEGVDTVYYNSTGSYTLTANVENLVTVANGTGNSSDNTVTGDTSSNTLTGGDGNDVLFGLGNNDVLFGGDGNDTLDGGTGNDSMTGGLGDDVYYLNSSGDGAFESAGGGTDTIIVSVTDFLWANVEIMILSGSAAIDGTGNATDNVIYGNSNVNTLNGAGGVDTLIGGAGNDVYVVDSTSDIISENSAEGFDVIQSSVTYTLASANVESVVLTGSSAINATGSSANDTLTGNTGINTISGADGNDVIDGLDGADVLNGGNGDDIITGGIGIDKLYGNADNDTLDGGTSADTLVGGTGNDTYIVDNASEVLSENASEGTDWIQSSVNWTIGTNFEHLLITGTATRTGTGNSGDNTIIGNTGVNTLAGADGSDHLFGNDGNDTLQGGNGNDFLAGQAGLDNMTGGSGADTFIFEPASAYSNIDVITDFNISTDHDILDVHLLLTAYDPLTMALTDFVKIEDSGSNSIVSIDRDGTGSTYSWTQVATLNGITGLTNEAALVTSGNLQVV